MEAKRVINTKNLVVLALFIALSFVGSYIKIFGTIAFDSLPAFLAALLLGPGYGALTGFLGHLFTALTSGFPLSIPMHLAIAAAMAITMQGFGSIYKALRNKISVTGNLVITGITGLVLNGPVSLALSMCVMAILAGKDAALGLLAMLPALVLASAANVIISVLLFKVLEKVWGNFMQKGY